LAWHGTPPALSLHRFDERLAACGWLAADFFQGFMRRTIRDETKARELRPKPFNVFRVRPALIAPNGERPEGAR